MIKISRYNNNGYDIKNICDYHIPPFLSHAEILISDHSVYILYILIIKLKPILCTQTI